MFKCRCSKIGDLMTNPRSKKAQEAGELSATAESVVFEKFVQDKTNRQKVVTSKYLDKGIYVEDDSITLLSNVLGKPLFKNKHFFENDFITGTPDIVVADTVIDVKSSWDVFTFYRAKISEVDKTYYAQLQGYMELTGATKAMLAYCLTDAPPWEIDYAQKRYEKLYPFASESDWERQKRNYVFDDMPDEQKVHIVEFAYDEDYILQVQERVKQAQNYYQQLNKQLK